MDEHPDVGCCSCPVSGQTALGTAKSGAFSRYPSLGRTLAENLWAVFRPPRSWDIRWLSTRVHRWMGEELPQSGVLDVAWVVGALLLVRRQVMEQTGGFDERFFLFDEDIDLCRRMRGLGWRVAFTTLALFDHQGGASSALRDDIERIRGHSRAWYFRKYHGRTASALFRLQHYLLCIHLLTWRRRIEALRRSAAAGSGDEGVAQLDRVPGTPEIERPGDQAAYPKTRSASVGPVKVKRSGRLWSRLARLRSMTATVFG
jgi:GT2 family glycosyltransferase